MKGMIFAAGIGSRLKPWTDEHPKALVEVGGMPMLQRVIARMTDVGINDIIINVHHYGEQIIDFVRNLDTDANISISDERGLLLDTGGGLRKALPMIGDVPVLIHNADILTDIDLVEFINQHSQSGADASLLVEHRGSARQLVFTANHALKGWYNRETGATRPDTFEIMPDYNMYSFNGVHIVGPSLFSDLRNFKPDEMPFSIIDFYLAEAASHKIIGYDMPRSAHWFDVGKPATLNDAREWISSID